MQRILYATLLTFAGLLALGLFLPRFATVELTITVDAPPSVVFAQADDVRRIQRWASLYADDPGLDLRYAGPSRGPGARLSWDGPLAGSGVLEIAESTPYDYVSYRLNPGEPGEAVSWLSIEAAAAGTAVTSGFEHDYGMNIVGRYFGLLWTRVIKRDLARGLERLKTVVEALPRVDFAGLDVERTYVDGTALIMLEVLSGPGAEDRTRTLGGAYVELLGFAARHKLEESGASRAIFRGMSDGRLRMEAAIPVSGVAESTPEREGNIRVGQSYEGNALQAVHNGPYATLSATRRQLESFMSAYGIEPNGDPWEAYLDSGERGTDAERRTAIVYPIRVY